MYFDKYIKLKICTYFFDPLILQNSKLLRLYGTSLERFKSGTVQTVIEGKEFLPT